MCKSHGRDIQYVISIALYPARIALWPSEPSADGGTVYWMIGTDKYDIHHFVHSTANARFQFLTAVRRKIQVLMEAIPMCYKLIK